MRIMGELTKEDTLNIGQDTAADIPVSPIYQFRISPIVSAIWPSIILPSVSADTRGCPPAAYRKASAMQKTEI